MIGDHLLTWSWYEKVIVPYVIHGHPPLLLVPCNPPCRWSSPHSPPKSPIVPRSPLQSPIYSTRGWGKVRYWNKPMRNFLHSDPKIPMKGNNRSFFLFLAQTFASSSVPILYPCCQYTCPDVSSCRTLRPSWQRPSLDFEDENDIPFAVQSGPGLLTVRPPGPVGPPERWEHRPSAPVCTISRCGRRLSDNHNVFAAPTSPVCKFITSHAITSSPLS